MYTVPEVYWHFKSSDIQRVYRSTVDNLTIDLVLPDRLETVHIPAPLQAIFHRDFPEHFVTSPELHKIEEELPF